MPSLSMEQFMSERVAPTIRAVACGMDQDDFVDAPWADLYESTGGEATDQEIIDTLAEQDEIFAGLAELNGA